MAVDPDLAGRSFPATEPYAVSREKILEFARATGSTYDGGPAPATFPIVVAFAAMTALMEDPEVGIALHRVAGVADGGGEGADAFGGDGQGRRRGELTPHQRGVDGHGSEPTNTTTRPSARTGRV
jgi:hypothetical protein